MFLGYRFYVEKMNQQVLIMDRYFYDTLVDITGARRTLCRRGFFPGLPRLLICRSIWTAIRKRRLCERTNIQSIISRDAGSLT